MKRLSRVLQMTVAALGVCLVATAPVQADISNGDFENGSADWSVSSDQFVAFSSNYYADTGTAATLSESDEYADYSYTTLWQDSVNFEEGEVLSFDFWLATEGGAETDWFYVLLNDGPTENVVYSKSTDGFEDGDVFHDDVTIPGVSPGEYTLMFRLVGEDDGLFTAATVDNVRLVPVPGAALLGGLGLCTAGWFCRRERRA